MSGQANRLKHRLLPLVLLAVVALLCLRGRELAAQQFPPPQREFQGTVQVMLPPNAGVPFSVPMPVELVADIGRFREVTVRYRVEKSNVGTATASTLKMQTAMSTRDDTEWKDIGTGVSLSGTVTTPAVSSETISVTSSQVLMRYLRWQVVFQTAPASGLGAVTFSIDVQGHM